MVIGRKKIFPTRNGCARKAKLTQQNFVTPSETSGYFRLKPAWQCCKQINYSLSCSKCPLKAEKAAALVPSREVMDRLGLYETRLRRQFNTALTQLERLQRARLSRDASPVSSPEGIVPENTETKKRTQSPSVNDNMETVNPASPAKSNNPTIQQPAPARLSE